MEMEQSLQSVNHNSQLVWWGQKVEECRKSGLKVAQWCAENGIAVSTYYNWQRKVFQAVTEREEICFVEVPVTAPAPKTTATIQMRDIRVELHSGADADTIQAIIRALNDAE